MSFLLNFSSQFGKMSFGGTGWNISTHSPFPSSLNSTTSNKGKLPFSIPLVFPSTKHSKHFTHEKHGMRSLITILQLFDILFINNTSLGLGPKGPTLVRIRIIKKKKKKTLSQADVNYFMLLVISFGFHFAFEFCLVVKRDSFETSLVVKMNWVSSCWSNL